MTKEHKIIGLVILVIAALYFGFISIKVGPAELGGGQGGTQTFFATSTQLSLANGEIQKLSASSTCVARTVTTGAGGIGLAFMDEPLTGTYLGHWQGASTTVTYPAETFGCGGLRVRAAAATLVNVQEFRDPR